MNYRNNIYKRYNYDISGDKIIYNKFKKKNFFPYILHNNLKNFRNKKRDSINCDYTLSDCSKNCPTKNNRKEYDKKNVYYERIYKGLDFNYPKNIKRYICWKKLECYKIPKFKNKTTLGMQLPNNCFDCNINNFNCNQQNENREKKAYVKINPYIPTFNKNENIKSTQKNNYINNLKNKNNLRYSNYSNYLKKKKFIRKCIN